MRYQSTRGQAPELDFAGALLSGLASDGGLYCPTEVPLLAAIGGLDELAPNAPYHEVATKVMGPYVEGSIEPDVFAELVRQSYAGFRHPDVCPLVELGDNQYLLDLTKGPTLAFKDIALQLVGRLFDHELARRHEQVVVVTATSGDTGSAAIEALAGRRNVAAVVLHPHQRVSEVQRRQMTTVTASNIDNVAVEGTFDDCQNLVKAAFADTAISNRYHLAAVNSINWARVMAQIVYYVTAARSVAAAIRAPTTPVSFTVPTGNFGNILAGIYAKRMGLVVDQLVVASNSNDVLPRFFETGVLEATEVLPTLSPSMDIQISSNLERLLWEASGRDGQAVSEVLTEFRTTGRAEVPATWTAPIKADLDWGRVDDDETLAEIGRIHDELGLLIDPHTAVGLCTARAVRRDPSVPMIVLATADPAKFPDAVEQATGVRPPLPPFLSELFDRSERYEVVANDLAAIAARVALVRSAQ
ncbi:MAG: threonine synthase [Actinomycetia bacterium]|nr:threonine synthase [Actinomycetes bacterium]MCP4225264.1 threonine synthase [Actinomycetes bacterium]MCP5031766.1 threonine synthase [Actinomycetes bacterium]